MLQSEERGYCFKPIRVGVQILCDTYLQREKLLMEGPIRTSSPQRIKMPTQAQRLVIATQRSVIREQIRSLAKEYAGGSPPSGSKAGGHVFEAKLCYGMGYDFYNVGRHFLVASSFIYSQLISNSE